MTMAKEKADMTKENPRCSIAEKLEEQPATPQVADLPMLVGQTKGGINPGIGTNKANTHPMRHPAPDKR